MKDINDWWRDKGDITLRLNYDLNEKSTVVDLGGYKGDWAGQIFNKYNCNLIILEPVSEYYHQICAKFTDKRIQVFNFGAGASDRIEHISIENDASSIFTEGTTKEAIKIHDASVLFKDLKIDLMKINIEGGEYELLDRLIETNKHIDIKNFQIQFHRIEKNRIYGTL